MNAKHTLFGLPLPHALSLASFFAGIVSIWIHLEIRIAEINVELANIKQQIAAHESDNRKDFESMNTGFSATTREILQKVDEIQIYLRDRGRNEK